MSDDIVILPDVDDLDIVRRLVEVPEYTPAVIGGVPLKAVTAEPVAEDYIETERGTWPRGYLGWGFKFYPDDRKDVEAPVAIERGDRYVMFLVTKEELRQATDLAGLWDTYLRRVAYHFSGRAAADAPLTGEPPPE